MKGRANANIFVSVEMELKRLFLVCENVECSFEKGRNPDFRSKDLSSPRIDDYGVQPSFACLETGKYESRCDRGCILLFRLST